MKKIILIYLSFFYFLASCNSDDSKYRKLSNEIKSNECKVDLLIDNKAFYNKFQVFNGEVFLDSNGIRSSLKNKQGGNVILSFEKNNWYKNKKISLTFKDGLSLGESNSSLLLGKLIESNRGEGYVFYSGNIVIEKIDPSFLIVSVSGKVRSPFDPTIEKKVEGLIFYKHPIYKISNINSKRLFLGS